MNLNDKIINFLGDSITEGVGASTPDTCYVEVLRRMYNPAQARNYGIGGTRIAPQKEASIDPQWDKDFCGRYQAMADDADIVVVFGGTNDFGHGLAPFGTVGDTTPATFCGACDTLYKGLKQKYPQAAIVVVTPIHRNNENDPRGDGYKPVGPLLAEYVDAIMQIAAANSLPVLDLFHGQRTCKDGTLTPDMFPDGLHPNDTGHKILAELIGDYLQTL